MEENIVYGEVEQSDSENNERSTDEESMFFSEFENLYSKDYTTSESKRREKLARKCGNSKHSEPSNSPFLTVKLHNNKEVKIRKSSLCWFFSEKGDRLSTDRLLRVKVMASSDRNNRVKNAAIKKNTRKKTKETETIS